MVTDIFNTTHLHSLFLLLFLFLFYAQNRELLEEARAAKCYRDELDIVKEKVSRFNKTVFCCHLFASKWQLNTYVGHVLSHYF